MLVLSYPSELNNVFICFLSSMFLNSIFILKFLFRMIHLFISTSLSDFIFLTKFRNKSFSVIIQRYNSDCNSIVMWTSYML